MTTSQIDNLNREIATLREREARGARARETSRAACEDQPSERCCFENEEHCDPQV